MTFPFDQLPIITNLAGQAQPLKTVKILSWIVTSFHNYRCGNRVCPNCANLFLKACRHWLLNTFLTATESWDQ